MSGTTADPDLWGHVRFGQDIVASGSLPLDDAYSFTSDRTWINHEWLAEVLMALAFDVGGPLGLNLLRVSVIGLILALVWRRLDGIDRLMRLQLIAMTALGIVLRVHPVRPQLFSVLLFAVMLTLIVRADERDSLRPLWLVPLVMVLWVNLHGGWLVGVGTLGCWIAARIAQRRAPSGRPVLLAAIGAAALAATAVNPYGMEMWRFLAGTVRLGRELIGDWQPMYSLPPSFAVLWLIPAAVSGLALIRARGRVDRTYLGLVVLMGVAALRVSRLDAFFMLTAVFLLAPMLRRSLDAPVEALPRNGSRAGAFTVTATAVAMVCIAAWRLPMLPMPVSSPEPEAAQYIRARGLEGNMLTWFDWGEYAIWHLSPRVRVSMDGRRETVYSEDMISRHMKFYAGAEGWSDFPDRIGADYIWLPRQLRVVSQLRAHGWRPAFEGPVSVLLTRSDRLVAVRSVSPSPVRQFPSM